MVSTVTATFSGVGHAFTWRCSMRISITLLIAWIFALAGCGGGGNFRSESLPPLESQQPELDGDEQHTDDDTDKEKVPEIGARARLCPRYPRRSHRFVEHGDGRQHNRRQHLPVECHDSAHTRILDAGRHHSIRRRCLPLSRVSTRGRARSLRRVERRRVRRLDVAQLLPGQRLESGRQRSAASQRVRVLAHVLDRGALPAAIRQPAAPHGRA